MNAPMTTMTIDTPFYEAAGNEIEVFEQAWKNRLPLLIKGPTGVGKTRFEIGRASCRERVSSPV